MDLFDPDLLDDKPYYELPEEDMDEAVTEGDTTVLESVNIRIKDDNDQTWLWNGQWLMLEGDESEDGGYPAYSYFDVVRIL